MISRVMFRYLSHGVVVCFVGIQLLLYQLSKLSIAVKVAAVSDGRVLSQGSTQCGYLLCASLQVDDAARLASGVVVELESLRNVQ